MERARTVGSGLRLALGLTLAVLVVELAGGLLSHSLALLADAGHVLTDVFALGLAWFAIEQSKRPADRHRSYGYQRVGILAALVNAAALIVIVLAIGFEAVRRLMTPESVQGGAVIATALAAIAINALVIVTLRGGSPKLTPTSALATLDSVRGQTPRGRPTHANASRTARHV